MGDASEPDNAAESAAPAVLEESAAPGDPPGPPEQSSLPDDERTGMSWWKRAGVSFGVLVAIGVTGSGILLVRHLLDHSVDPQALMQSSTHRLAALDPLLAGFDVSGADRTASVACGQGTSCASASRHFRPTSHTAAAALIEAADAWASVTGLGSSPDAGTRPIVCTSLSGAPVRGLLCDVRTYAVPGVPEQQVHVYAQLSANGKTLSRGVFSSAQVVSYAVGSVYVQVLTSKELP